MLEISDSVYDIVVQVKTTGIISLAEPYSEKGQSSVSICLVNLHAHKTRSINDPICNETNISLHSKPEQIKNM